MSPTIEACRRASILCNLFHRCWDWPEARQYITDCRNYFGPDDDFWNEKDAFFPILGEALAAQIPISTLQLLVDCGCDVTLGGSNKTPFGLPTAWRLQTAAQAAFLRRNGWDPFFVGQGARGAEITILDIAASRTPRSESLIRLLVSWGVPNLNKSWAVENAIKSAFRPIRLHDGWTIKWERLNVG